MNNILNEIVRPLADKMLERADLPKDKQKAETRKKVFLDELKSLNYEYDVNGKIVVKNNNGFSLSDDHGWEYSIDEVVNNIFNKYFEVSKWPLSEAEYVARLKDKKITPAERIQLVNYWQNR
jgi:hypothetical protein